MIWYLPENMKTGDQLKLKNDQHGSVVSKILINTYEDTNDIARELVYRYTRLNEKLIEIFEEGIKILQEKELDIPIYLCSYSDQYSRDIAFYVVKQLSEYDDEYIYLYNVHVNKILGTIN